MSADEDVVENDSRIQGTINPMLISLQNRALLPMVRNVKECLITGNDYELLIQLQNINNFLLTFTESFAEALIHEPPTEFCGLHKVLFEIISKSNVNNPEVEMTSLRCIKIMVDNSSFTTDELVRMDFLVFLNRYFQECEFLELIEAAVDSFGSFAKRVPGKVIQALNIQDYLHHFEFMTRASQITMLSTLTKISDNSSNPQLSKFNESLQLIFEIMNNHASDSEICRLCIKIFVNLQSILLSNPSFLGKNSTILNELLFKTRDFKSWLEIYFLCVNTLILPGDEIFELGLVRLETFLGDCIPSAKSQEMILELLISIVKLSVNSKSIKDISKLPILLHDSKLIIPNDSHSLDLLANNQDFCVADLQIFSCLRSTLRAMNIFPYSSKFQSICIVILYLFLLEGRKLKEHDNNFDMVLDSIVHLILSIGNRDDFNSLLSLAALTVLSNDKDLNDAISQYYNFEAIGNWNLGPVKEFVIDSMSKLLSAEILVTTFDSSQLINTMAYKLESKLRDTCPSEEEDTTDMCSRVEALLEQEDSQELIRFIRYIHRKILLIDPALDIIQYPLDNSKKSVFDLVADICKPVKVSLTAEIDDKRVYGDLIINVDPLWSPARILRIVRFGNSIGDFTVNLTLSTTQQPVFIDWTKHKCLMSIDSGEARIINPLKPIISSYINEKVFDNGTSFKSFVEKLFSKLIKLQIMPLPPPHQEEINTNPSPNSLSVAINSLDLIFFSQKSNALQEELVNQRLDDMLFSYINQVVIMCCEYIPPNLKHLIQEAPYLFSFKTKVEYLVATCFGAHRYLDRLQAKLRKGGEITQEIKVARVGRQKFLFSKDQIYRQGRRAFELYPFDFCNVFEFQSTDDVGAGLGPTLEFYTNFSRSLQMNSLTMWLSEDPGSENAKWQTGLFPSPKALIDDFRFLGMFVARAILDSRVIDLPLNIVFLNSILGNEFALSLKTLSEIDPQLAASLKRLHEAPPEAFRDLYWVHPSYSDIELCEGGAERLVNQNNLDDYIDLLLQFVLNKSLNQFSNAFRDGFNQLLSINSFRIFTPHEFLLLLNGENSESWESSVILNNIRTDHGYTTQDCQILWMAKVFSEFTKENKTLLLQFLTGAQQLPSGGWSQLSPPLTVVCRKDPNPDRTLPSVMTCANYLKMPRYSSKDILRERFIFAIREGQGSFSLS